MTQVGFISAELMPLMEFRIKNKWMCGMWYVCAELHIQLIFHWLGSYWIFQDFILMVFVLFSVSGSIYLSGALHCVSRNTLCSNIRHVTCVCDPLVRTGCHFSPFSFMDSLWTQLGRRESIKSKNHLFFDVLLVCKTEDIVSWCVYFNACMRRAADEG